MSTRLDPAPAPLRGPARLLSHTPARFAGRSQIEAYLDELNLASPVADRRIVRWGADPADEFSVGAVLHSPVTGNTWAGEVFLGESHFSFGLDVRTRNPGAAPPAYAIGLPLSGRMSVTLAGREVCAEAGEGVVIDPADVERTQVTGGSHFVEFHLPKTEVQRLAETWLPGTSSGAPRFVPHLSGPLAQRLLYMAAQAAQVLEAPGHPAGARMLFQRWTEMIALTLLHEQRLEAGPARRAAVGAPAPACVRRAIDFIQAHADGAIGLADIAEAACASASSLLRHFNVHLGLSPYAYLRAVRLERAREQLQRQPGLTIRDVALRWGFQNASKFSHAYESRFGEKPSATRVRAAE